MFSFFLSYYGYHQALHSFPTRRSSDLIEDFTLSQIELKDHQGLTIDVNSFASPQLFDLNNDGLLDLRSEEHTSELQSRPHLVCRLLLEKKKSNQSSLYEKCSLYIVARFPLIYVFFFFIILRLPPSSTLFPYTTLFRSNRRFHFESN